MADREAQFERHIFPLSVIGEGGWALPLWCKGYEQHWQGKADAAVARDDPEAAEEATRRAHDATAFGEHLKGITEQYQIAYIELDRELELDKVCDIFTQINSRGIRLDVFDLINALLKPKGLQLKHMWRTAAPRLDFVETPRMNVYALQVMSILRQAYCSPKYLYYLLPGQEKKVRDADGSLHVEVLIPNIAAFQKDWNEAVDAMERAIHLLRHPQEFGAISSTYLPYVSILPVFAALQQAVRGIDPNRRLDAQRKIRHWYWASVFTNRYSGSVESTAARDFLAVKAWFADDHQEPDLIGEFQNRFVNLDLSKETRRGTSVYNGIFNLLVLHGARDWMTGNVPQYGDLDDHHIVPQRWGKDHGLAGTIDTILNRTPLTADTNRNVIRDRLPNQYVPELMASNGEAAVRSTLESHFLSSTAIDILLREPFTVADFTDFLSERQKTLRSAIEDLLVKERLDLPPHLRDLDARVEKIELELRRRVVKGLNGSVAELPSHVAQKMDERIQLAAAKSPAFDLEQYDSLERRLEYADLREVQATILNKARWESFSQLFGNKEILNTRFDQLAELRNGIRHSRTVGDVTRKDGEAAILWFEQLLARRH